MCASRPQNLIACLILTFGVPAAGSAQPGDPPTWQPLQLGGEGEATYETTSNGGLTISFTAAIDAAYQKSLNIGEVVSYARIPDFPGDQGVTIAPSNDPAAPRVSLVAGKSGSLILEWRAEEGAETRRWQLRELLPDDRYLHLVSQRHTTYLYTSRDGQEWVPEIAVETPTETTALGGVHLRAESAGDAQSAWLGTHSLFFAEIVLEGDGGGEDALFSMAGGTLAGTYEVFVKGGAGSETTLGAHLVTPADTETELGQVALRGDGLWEFAGRTDLEAGSKIRLLGEGAGAAAIRVLGTGWEDADEDGMPDVWEKDHGLNPAVADANGDADKDGIPNIFELFMGTNPLAADADGPRGNVLYVDPQLGSDHFDGWRRLHVAGRSLGPKRTLSGATKTLGGAPGTIEIKGGHTVHEIDVIGPGLTIIPVGDVIIGTPNGGIGD